MILQLADFFCFLFFFLFYFDHDDDAAKMKVAPPDDKFFSPNLFVVSLAHY